MHDELLTYGNSMAGHDVLAVTIRAVIYYVARSAQVETRLRVELDSVHSKYALDDDVPFEELNKLPFLYV